MLQEHHQRWGKDENHGLLKGCATCQDSWCQAELGFTDSPVMFNPTGSSPSGQTDYQISLIASLPLADVTVSDNQDK